MAKKKTSAGWRSCEQGDEGDQHIMMPASCKGRRRRTPIAAETARSASRQSADKSVMIVLQNSHCGCVSNSRDTIPSTVERCIAHDSCWGFTLNLKESDWSDFCVSYQKYMKTGCFIALRGFGVMNNTCGSVIFKSNSNQCALSG